MMSAAYGVCARRVTVVEGEEPRAELIRCNTVTDLLDLAPLLDEYAAAYADDPDILIELDTTPTN